MNAGEWIVVLGSLGLIVVLTAFCVLELYVRPWQRKKLERITARATGPHAKPAPQRQGV
jgi:hypothetical protein